MNADVERSLAELRSIARDTAYFGRFTPEQLREVRSTIGCGIEQVKRAAWLCDQEAALRRADDVHDLKELLGEILRKIA